MELTFLIFYWSSGVGQVSYQTFLIFYWSSGVGQVSYQQLSELLLDASL